MSLYDELGKKLTEKSRKRSLYEELGERMTYKSIDTSGVDKSYIDSLINDATDYISTAEKDYGGVGYGNASSTYDNKYSTWKDLNTRSRTIRAWLFNNRNSLDTETYNGLMSDLYNIEDSIKSVRDGFKSASDYYAQWDTEDSYNEWYENQQKLKEMASSENASVGWEKYLAAEEAAKNKLKNDFNNDGKETFWEKTLGYIGNGAPDTTLPTAGVTQATYDLMADKSYARPKDDWDEEQKLVFGYLYSMSPADAYEYAITTNNELNSQKEALKLKSLYDASTANGWAMLGHTLGSIASAPLGLADYLSNLAYANAGRDVSTQDGFITPFEYSQAVTSGISSHLNEKYGTIDDDVWMLGGKGLGDLYGLGTSIAQSMASAYTLGGAGTLVSYFGQGAAAGVDEALSRGASDWQAVLYGTSLGVFEGIFEMLGVDNLFKLGSSSTIKGFIKNILNQAGAEGMEEGLTSLFSNIADIAIMQDKSNFNFLVAQYMAQGMSEKDAEKKAWMDTIGGIAFDTIAGAVSGGVSGGISTIVQNVAQSKAISDYGNSIIEQGGQERVDALVKLANEMYGGKKGFDASVGKTLAKKTEKNPSAKNVGKLTNELQSTIDKRKASDIVRILKGQGFSTKETNLAVEYLTGTERLSVEVKNQVESNEKLMSAIDTMLSAGNLNINDSSAKFAKAMSEGKKPTTTAKIPSENRFKASEDGKARYEGKEVSVKEISSVKDGNLTLRLSDGKTVDASNVILASDEIGMLYTGALDMELNAATANSFVNGYQAGTDVEDYIKGFKEAYTYGENGFALKDMSEEGFVSTLTEEQKNMAYNLGKIDAKYKKKESESAEEKTAETKEPTAQKNQKKGKLYNKLTPQNETQRSSLKALSVLAEALGVDIYTFESKFVNGKRTGANGWYDPATKSIHVDLYAGNDGKGTMLFTAAHELTHYIRDKHPTKFDEFAGFLFEKYEENGVSVQALVEAKRKFLKEKGRITPDMTLQQAYDLAYEEVVADACESFLADGEAVAKIAELKARDKTLWETIKEFLTKLVAKIKAAYEGLSPDSEAGSRVADMLEAAEELKEMWTEALVEASEVDSVVEIDTASGSVSPMFSERTWTESEYVIHRDKMAEKISKALGVTTKKAKSYIDDINSIAKMIADDRVRLDYEASSFGSAFVSNVEYGGSFDYTTLCKKRRIYTGTFTEIQKRLKDVALTPDDILTIRNLMIEKGIEATCGLCYVEGSRANMGKFAKEFIRLYKRDNPNAWIPNMADVNTPDGVEQMRINHPEAYYQYVYFWNHYGKLKDSDKALFASQQKPKLYEARKEYKGEILEHFKGDTAVEKKNLNGGIRMQSFSDFEIVHLIDTMQVIMDMSTVGLAGQAYTKVPEFAMAFGNTGLKINLSLIAKGVDADGKLIFDDVEGMPNKTAFDIRNKYSKNVGTIIVTFTDEQLLAAMADPRIDFIIPFHRSQWKKGQYGAMGLPKGTKDYTYMQNEKLIKQTYHEYRGKMVKDKASNYMPNEYWDFSKSGKENAEAYLKMCAENNKRPKFYKLLDYDGNGTYSLKADGTTDGYWKLLIDFKMYDNDGAGSPQMAVTPTFNMDEAMTMLDEYKGGHSKYPVASSVVDKFVEDYNSKHNAKETVLNEGQVLYSDRSFASQVDAVLNGADTNSTHLKLMDTPSLLQEAGFPNLPILMTAKHLRTITSTSGKDKGNYHGLDVEIVKKLPDYISDPVMIADSLTREDSIVIITEAIDSENRPVVAAIMLNGVGQLDNKYINANIMTSAYGKDNFQSFLDRIANSNSVIYWDEKKSQDLSVNLGVQFPNVITSLRSSVIIHQAKAFVNTQNEKTLRSDRNPDSFSNRSLLANALEGVVQNDIERNKLNEYKNKISLIESEQARLAELNAKLHDLRFSKGKRSLEDNAQIKELQAEATILANRINTYDRQLLNLESTKALKGVLEREKKKAYEKAKQKGQEALKAQKEKSLETLNAQRDYYQEARKRGIESRHKTEMRHKVKNTVNELYQMLLHGTKERNVKVGLQDAVASALQAVNMDTVAADERIAKLEQELVKAKTPEKIQEISRKIDYIRDQGDRMEAKLQKLRKAYEEISTSSNEYYKNEAERIKEKIDDVVEKVGETPLRNMSLSQLQAVYELYKMVLTTVRDANQLFKNGKVEDLRRNVLEMEKELASIPLLKEERRNIGEGVRKFAWNEMTPVYAFQRIGSPTFTSLYWELIRGQNTYARDYDEADTFATDTRETYHYKKWDLDKIHTFKLSDGREFRVTLRHMMSIYAYSKREQAIDHMSIGGFFFNDKETFTNKGGMFKMIKSNEEGYKVDKKVLSEIINELTDEQIAYVDEMQDYLTKMGEKGNEVSRTVWGIDLFKEKYYFPLKSSQDFIAQSNQPAQATSLKNDGMTKEIKPGASNPIVLEAFDDVWAKHVNRMSQYHAFVIPIENINKVLNYGTWTGDTSKSVTTMIRARYSSAAVDYLNNFVKDCNGSITAQGATSPTIGLIGKFKKTAVAASTSVILQQPTAVIRATAEIDAKYFIGLDPKRLSTKWEEVRKYAPIAIIKEIGGFDMGGTRASIGLNDDTLTGKDKVMSKIDEYTMKGAEVGDKIGWCIIFDAVKREIKATTNLQEGSEAFLKRVGERFTEVVVLTQVYDSTLSRSGFMRSQSEIAKMATSFMGEPTVSINMMYNAMLQAKRHKITKRKATGIISAVYVSVIMASVASSLIYALRDDDDDESYLEKFGESFVVKALGDLNPVAMLPYARDVVSIFQGWDVERTDMSVITDIYNGFTALDSKNKSVWRKIEDLAGSIAAALGIPLKNVLRTAREIYNAIRFTIE